MIIDYIPIKWDDKSLKLLDQRKLPLEEHYIEPGNIDDIYLAIKDMIVRGAPLIGFTAICGLALFAEKCDEKTSIEDFKKACDYLKASRPTAVNLMYEVDESFKDVKELIQDGGSWHDVYHKLRTRLVDQMERLESDNLTMAKSAERRLFEIYGDRKLNLMTLCNTGFLACGPMGTALGVVSHLNGKNKVGKVFASETRPYLQGIRLTSWELQKEGIEHELVVEGAASHLLKSGMVDAIFIGADRIVANGDTANKIGSSSLAIIAKHFKIPFFVVAPTSSFDLSLNDGSLIEIEFRDEEEVLSCMGLRLAPKGTRAFNPSFDVTDHELITSIFCEKGEIHPVDEKSVSALFGEKQC